MYDLQEKIRFDALTLLMVGILISGNLDLIKNILNIFTKIFEKSLLVISIFCSIIMFIYYMLTNICFEFHINITI